MKNTFTGLVESINNRHIYAVCVLAMRLRMQLTCRQEARTFSGWGDDMNKYMLDSLADLYNVAKYGAAAKPGGVMMPAMATQIQFPHDLRGPAHGGDINIPQPTNDVIRNDFLLMFIQDLDVFMKMCTTFDSRHLRRGISPFEFRQVEAQLEELTAICNSFGGDANLRSVPSGVLPADFDNTFNHHGGFDTNTQNFDMGNVAVPNRGQVDQTAAHNSLQNRANNLVAGGQPGGVVQPARPNTPVQSGRVSGVGVGTAPF